ncbi:RecB family nuclease, putative, TM0106 family [Catalinimonas alkaloidigena]|uniref:RecB family nuclease, putative, TM0106 family n=1 Tax=Catalinimonas alkaloidigena TaxID=1075417 RepID=A0A1G8WW99_9BACT|nr:hypothetical protein [Catalinimonas alkaloidigena]SDJ82638.1 RecB family nuclease, putative, TM0106 family [Catalinimonas alkaloidigena]
MHPDAFRPQPKPTNGHQFGAYLNCPRKAWFNYHATSALKAPVPLALRAMQQEGLQYEKEVIERQYAGAFEVTGQTEAERLVQTEKAMRGGEPVILQAQLLGPERVGVADILERVASGPGYRLGHLYQVGDIKSSKTVTLHNLLQIGWYSRLLTGLQGTAPERAFLIMGDGRREEVEVALVETILRETYYDLMAVRRLAWEELNEKHPPVLSRNCMTCQYRYECMPRVQAADSLSLLPDLGAHRLAHLKAHGLHTWRDLALCSDAQLEELEFSDVEIQRSREAIERLRQGRVLFRKKLRDDLFRKTALATLELKKQPEGYRAIALVYRIGQNTYRAPITYDEWEQPQFELPTKLQNRRLILYGLDYATLRKILRQTKQLDLVTLFDVFSFIEKYVHAPLPGLELGELHAYLRGDQEYFALRDTANTSLTAEEYARQRLETLTEVARWLHENLASLPVRV